MGLVIVDSTQLETIADDARSLGGTSNLLTLDQIHTILSGAGGSSFTKLAETSLGKISTESTTATNIATTINLTKAVFDAWDVIYTKIRGTKTSGVLTFLGSDNFAINLAKLQGGTSLTLQQVLKYILYNDSSNKKMVNAQGGITGYGIFLYSITNQGVMTFRSRYNATYGAINDTYKAEVYGMNIPGWTF